MKKEENLQIVTITCSSKDYFSKKRAKTLFDKWINDQEGIVNTEPIELPHPIIAEIPIKDNKPKFTFMNYCKATYKRLKTNDIVINIEGDADVQKIELISRKGKYVLQVTQRS